MSKKPAPKKKPPSIVNAVDLSGHSTAAKRLRRVISYALASGMRNVLSADVRLRCPPAGRPYREIQLTMIDYNTKAKW